MVLATWPQKSIFGMANSDARVAVANSGKIDKDVDDIIDALLDDVHDKGDQAVREEGEVTATCDRPNDR